MTFAAEFYQLGVVTEDIGAMVAYYDRLGAVGWKYLDTCYRARCGAWTGEVANRNAFAMWQGLCLELIEPGRGISTASLWLAERGPGIFHLGFVADDMSARPNDAPVYFESFGALTDDGGPAVIHLDTVDRLGHYVELSDRALVTRLLNWIQAAA